ncbi:MAG TPA: site-specific integrase [Candidatus Solibacter sp.]|nr:site-specific integrase [Candidatus Solibacter sp.]
MARRRYQKGWVLLRGRNPVWVGRWREYVIGSDGEPECITRSVVLGSKSEIPTMRLALRRLEAYLWKINSLDYRPGRIATVAEFGVRWTETVLSQYKASSQKAALSHLQCHILPQLGSARLDQVGRETLQVFVTRLSRSISRKTIFNVVGTLSAMLRKAKEWGYLCECVDFRALKFPECSVRPEPRFFTAKQVQQIVEAAKEPFRTMFLVLAMTGIRSGELLALQVCDLDFERKLVFIRRSAWYGKIQTTKSRASTKPLPMPGALSETLRSYLQSWKPNSMGLLFANQVGHPCSANKIVQRKLWPILDSLGLPRCGLHAFRHTHSSLLIDSGASPTVAQEQLRHSDPRVTLAIYSHVIGDSQRNAVEKVAELLRPNAPKSEGAGQYIQ